MSDAPLPDSDSPRYDQPWLAEARAMHGLDAVGEDASPAGWSDASDPEQIKKARREQRLAERSIAATIHEMMRLKEGRAVFYRQLERLGAFRASDFPPGYPTDPLLLAANATERKHAQLITNELLAWAPEQYLLMLKEAQSED